MERTQLFDLMGELKLYGMKAAFDEIMATAVKRQHEPQRIVGDLLNADINEKQARSIKYQLTIAKLPLAKDLDGFQFEGTPINQTLVNDLAGGGFIAQQRNAVLVGGTGTGKTHLAIAIARSCVRSGARGRFYNVVDLVNRGWPLCRPAQEGHRAMRGRKALDPGLGTSAGLSETAQWQIPDRAKSRLQAARHDHAVCSTGSRHREDPCDAFETTSPGRVSRLHGSRRRSISEPPQLHVILDNLSTHQKNEEWLKAHPNVKFHFTPTSASWLNQVEVWFSILQGQSLSGASFTSLKQLEQHIDAYINAYNDRAEPFVWTKKKVRQRPFKGRRITQL